MDTLTSKRSSSSIPKVSKNAIPKVSIYGFTLLRNGVQYDYAFKESLTSLLGVTEKVYLALGESSDGTEAQVAGIPGNIQIIPTQWDDAFRKGGLILSQQTNIALEKLREEQSGWGIYLQADEVLHEEDYELIKMDIAQAEDSGCDVVRFRYLHFWQTHNAVAINKKWYPQEIRAVKLDSKVESWGDAQSFRNFERAYESEAIVYHYGHVRNPAQYLKKKEDFLKLYHSDDRLSKYRRREKRFDGQTELIPFYGRHPQLMQKRIELLGDVWELPVRERVSIVGNPKNYSPELLQRIRAEEIQWCERAQQAKEKKHLVIESPNWWQRLIYHQHTPLQMRSKLARPWTNDFRLKCQLFEKGVGVR